MSIIVFIALVMASLRFLARSVSGIFFEAVIVLALVIPCWLGGLDQRHRVLLHAVIKCRRRLRGRRPRLDARRPLCLLGSPLIAATFAALWSAQVLF